MSRRYDQYCPIAHALDVVGERWSLLVVRELQHGPLRYTDLMERLQGCSTNVLASRLKDLEANDVVRRSKLPPPFASTVYELTECGMRLRTVLSALALWGLRTLGPPPPEALEPGWLEKALRTSVVPVAGEVTVAFAVGDEEASVVAGEAVPGLAAGADAIVRTDANGLYELFVDGRLGAVEIEGDRSVVERILLAAGAPVSVPALTLHS